MRSTSSFAVLVLAVAAFVTPGCCCLCPGSGGGGVGEGGGLSGPATGIGVVEIYRGTVAPVHLVGYVTMDASGNSYWLLKYNEVAPVIPVGGADDVAYHHLNNNDVDTATWCASSYAVNVTVGQQKPKLWTLNPSWVKCQ